MIAAVRSCSAAGRRAMLETCGPGSGTARVGAYLPGDRVGLSSRPALKRWSGRYACSRWCAPAPHSTTANSSNETTTDKTTPTIDSRSSRPPKLRPDRPQQRHDHQWLARYVISRPTCEQCRGRCPVPCRALGGGCVTTPRPAGRRPTGRGAATASGTTGGQRHRCNRAAALSHCPDPVGQQQQPQDQPSAKLHRSKRSTHRS